MRPVKLMTEDDMDDSDTIDFCDFDALEKLQEERARRQLVLTVKARNGDEKAKKSLSLFLKSEAIIKARARAMGFYWI